MTNRIEVPEGWKYCSRCKKAHPLYYTDESGIQRETFSRSTRNGWQAWCKKSATQYNVKKNRERRALQRDFPVEVTDEQVLRETRIVSEHQALIRVTKTHSPFSEVAHISEVKVLFDRCDYKCVVCGSPHVNIAHIKTLYNGGMSTIDNLIPLCNMHKIQKGHQPLEVWAKQHPEFDVNEFYSKQLKVTTDVHSN